MHSYRFKKDDREIRDHKMNSVRRRVSVAIVCGALAVAVTASPVYAASNELAQEGGTGALAALTTLVYGPLKILYATGGLIFGGLAYGFSGGNKDVLNAVLTPTVRGDYVVTPRALRGDDNLHFLGQDPQYRDDMLAVEDVY